MKVYIPIVSLLLLAVSIESRCTQKDDYTYLSHPNRNQFVMCLNGQEVVGTCPANMEFDPFERICDAADGATTTARAVVPTRTAATTTRVTVQTRPPTQDACHNTADGTYLPHPTSRSRFLLCRSGVGVAGDCPAGMEFIMPDAICDTPRTADECSRLPEGHIRVDPNSNRHYYTCWQGSTYHMECPNGMIFFPNDAFCNYGTAATTTARPIPTRPPVTRPTATAATTTRPTAPTRAPVTRSTTRSGPTLATTTGRPIPTRPPVG